MSTHHLHTEESRRKAAETRAKRGRLPSMRAAINAKCKDCIYDPESALGTWRQQVEACTIEDCPLWLLRPVSSGAKTTIASDG